MTFQRGQRLNINKILTVSTERNLCLDNMFLTPHLQNIRTLDVRKHQWNVRIWEISRYQNQTHDTIKLDIQSATLTQERTTRSLLPQNTKGQNVFFCQIVYVPTGT